MAQGISDFAAVVVLRFAHVFASYLGVPNEEAISGHPLASSGLRPFEFVRVAPSPWIAELERMNRVHEHHDPARSGRLSHFALPMHDTTFECVARSVAVETMLHADTPGAAAASHLSGIDFA